MNYREKYKEAIEGIQEILGSGEDSIKMSRLQLRLQGIFPELKESEDERIVKELLTFFRESMHGGHILTNKEYDSWIAWLEKQGQKDILEDAILDGNEDGLIAETIKYKNEKQSEKKPAWNKEDKGIIEEVVSYLINYSNIVESKEDADRIEYLIDKIQDICPHQKQEWSEEDEQHIDSLLKRLDALCRNKFERTRFAISEDRDWLKSLRPQNTWKPSDEQKMQFFDMVCDWYFRNFPKKVKRLNHLVNLDKLKEE